jgi:Phage protein (N4 Gp49/phage Sf6 gene 66) family
MTLAAVSSGAESSAGAGLSVSTALPADGRMRHRQPPKICAGVCQRPNSSRLSGLPCVTKQRIEGRIASVDYHCLGATVTLCNVTLDNGYSVRGESACVDPANFNEEIGNRIAYDPAFRQLWPLFGCLLAEQRLTAAA